ncbi:MAG: hypothetical protein B5M48_03410 [Candidatus Omnitrophica bacterium 4484_213]|nr:MAG: hypothetical protein B5M48_03410 [Candidatus Omnitrophica bacterium 4484_213]
MRANAAWGLGRIGDDSAVVPLIGALKDKRKEVRHGAAHSLADIGEPAVPALLKALEDERLNVERDEHKRAWAIHGIIFALGEIGDKSAVPYIYKLLKDKDWNIIMYATEALCVMGDETVIYDLMRIGGQEKIKARNLLDKFRRSNRENMEEKEAMEMKQHTGQWTGIYSGISNVGEPIIHTLIKALKNKDWQVRYFAVKLLENLSMNYSAYKSIAIPALIKNLKDERPEIRKAVEKTLKFMTQEDFGKAHEKWQEWWERTINENKTK